MAHVLSAPRAASNGVGIVLPAYGDSGAGRGRPYCGSMNCWT
jgi:hypothetical protein